MSTLFESKSEANDLPPEEQEQQRLIEIFNGQFPEPQNLSSTDRAYVLRYLNNTNLLTFRTTGLERFLANTGVLPDGRVICTIHSTSSDHRLFPVGWGNKFGSCLRLALRTNKAPIQAVFIPGDTEFEALQSSQTIILAFVRLGRLQTLRGIDLTSSVELKSALLQLLALCALNHSEIEKMEEYIFDPVLVRANSVTETVWGQYWTRLEWLQRGWINACARRSHNALAEFPARNKQIPTQWSHIDVGKYQLLDQVRNILSSPTLSNGIKLRKIIETYKSLPITQLIREGVAIDTELETMEEMDAAAFKNLRSIAAHIWTLLELDPELSDWGRVQISWDTAEATAPSIVLEPNGFPLSKDEEATSYWEDKRDQIMPHRNELLLSSDFPFNPRIFLEKVSQWQVDLDEREAEEAITQLLNEAVALREWTIPPNAFCEISCGPFIGVEVTEIGHDVYFIWRASDKKYWNMSVDINTHGFLNTEIALCITNGVEGDNREIFLNRKAQLSVHLLMAAIIRDFWVVAEREKIFGIKRGRDSKGNGKLQQQHRVIYLPRVRYVGSTIDLHNLNDRLSYKSRSQHYVKSFLRKARPSPLQIEIARRARHILPEGYTYVSGHYRGIGGTDGKKIYRSRSALELLFELTATHEVIQNAQFSTDWFQFEKAISLLLEQHFKFTIQHRAARGKTDYGVDILATKYTGSELETWAVQCKCYKPSNLVDPSRIRELIGAMSDSQTEGMGQVRGMMVTTSAFSGEALRLAVKHGIQCISGEDLRAIMHAINVSNAAPVTH